MSIFIVAIQINVIFFLLQSFTESIYLLLVLNI